MTWRRWRRDELRCKEVGRILQRYLDGELDDLRTRQVARHLADCLRCGMAAESYTQIKRALRRSAGPLPDDAVRRLRAFGEELAAGRDPGEEESAGA